jgi:peroxin-14
LKLTPLDMFLRSWEQMLEKHAQTQAASLLDLQSELKSLKTLLLARRPATSPAPAPTANGPASPLQEGAGASSTERAANALLQPRPGSGLGFANVGKPSIPAWQLAGSSAANGSSSQVNGDKSGENTTSSSQAAQVETVADEE